MLGLLAHVGISILYTDECYVADQKTVCIVQLLLARFKEDEKCLFAGKVS